VQTDAEEYLQWMREDERFADISPSIDQADQNVFPRMSVKTRKQLVALDQEVDLSRRGTYVSSARWKEMLESQLEGQEKYLMVDVRNDYEWDLGHFEGMERPSCTQFRQFPRYLRSLKASHDPKTTKVMMCCTGGIRGELYSALLKEEGFEEVYQLQGGILKYAKEEGGKHWKGKLFVFDDRLAVSVNPKESSFAGACLHCEALVDRFYNCANMDCNELFLCCPICLKQFAGCCKEECRSGRRVRPYDHQLSPKPFRKWYHYICEKERKVHDSDNYAAVSSDCSSKTS
jgi:UPF0176 protein